jgi:hypothetical protein
MCDLYFNKSSRGLHSFVDLLAVHTRVYCELGLVKLPVEACGKRISFWISFFFWLPKPSSFINSDRGVHAGGYSDLCEWCAKESSFGPLTIGVREKTGRRGPVQQLEVFDSSLEKE